MSHAPAIFLAQRRGCRLRGFTLIEVLAAMLMIAIALPVIMHGISMATNVASLSRQRNQAAALAQLKLGELISTGQWQNGGLSGSFDPEFPGVQWSAEVNTWTEPEVSELDLHVTWIQRNQTQNLTVSTLLYSGNIQSQLNGITTSSGTSTGGTK